MYLQSFKHLDKNAILNTLYCNSAFSFTVSLKMRRDKNKQPSWIKFLLRKTD